MLGSVLKFFKDELTAHFQLMGLAKSTVEFPKSNEGNRESIDFVPDALNLLMVNLEEENTMRQSDAFRQEKNGRAFAAMPEIRLNLYLLFVADRSDYLACMHQLSLVSRHFQARRVFTHNSAPSLPQDIEKLTVELITLPFAQQNEVWNALRTSYKPSLLYKVRMLAFSQDEPLQPPQPIQGITIQTTE